MSFYFWIAFVAFCFIWFMVKTWPKDVVSDSEEDYHDREYWRDQ